MLFSHFSLSWRLEHDPASLAMKCKQWTKRLAYTYTAFILTFASSLLLMVYMHTSTSTRTRLRNESFPVSVDEEKIPNDSIPLVDFNDLGNRKEQVLLLVTVGSAPQRYDRRQAIRTTWWKHCKHTPVNMSIGVYRISWGWVQIIHDISDCQRKEKLSVDIKEVQISFDSFKYENSSLKPIII